MSSAVTRFVAARRNLRKGFAPSVGWSVECPHPVWEAALRSQAALRALEPELTIPISVARHWAVQAATRAIDYPSSGAVPAVVLTGVELDAIKALCGWYVRASRGDESQVLGPFDSVKAARRAAAAAQGHGWATEIEDRTDPVDALSIL